MQSHRSLLPAFHSREYARLSIGSTIDLHDGEFLRDGKKNSPHRTVIKVNHEYIHIEAHDFLVAHSLPSPGSFHLSFYHIRLSTEVYDSSIDVPMYIPVSIH